jgi:hypothetical protein
LAVCLALPASPARAQFKRTPGFWPQTPTTNEPPKPETLSHKPGPAAQSNQAASGSQVSSLEALKLPAGAIVVLCDQAQQALHLIPRAIVLAPEEYEKLLDQIERLKRERKTDKPETPSACRITGRVEEGLAHLQLKFAFKTSKPKALVNLGCQRAWPTAATLDGQLPWIQSGDEGYVLEVDSSGAHQATLEVSLPVISKKGDKGGDQALDLDLPRSAITNLEQLDLPSGSTEIKLGTQPLRITEANAQRTRVANVPISPVDHLEMTWKGKAAEAVKGPAVSAATGRLIVRVDQANVVTDAELTLQVLRGQKSEWQVGLQLPAGATYEVSAHPEDESRIHSITHSEDKASPIVRIRLAEAGSESLRLIFHIRQPRSEQPLPIVVPRVLDALSQSGQIEFRAAANVRLRFDAAGTVSQRSLSDDERQGGARAAFSYWKLPANAGRSAVPLMTVEAETVKGAVEIRTTHLLRMMKAGSDDSYFRIKTKFDVTPIRTALDRIDLTLPPGYQYDANEGPAPVDLVEDISIDTTRHTAVVKLAEKQTRPFSLTISGSSPVPKGQEHVSLELPQAAAREAERSRGSQSPAPAVASPGVYDRGGQMTVTMPEGLELASKDFLPSADGGAPNPLQSLLLPLRSKSATRDYTWQGERIPQRLDLAWREYRPEMAVHSTANIDISERQARIRHRLRFQSPQAGLPQSLLHVPSGLQEKVRMLAGGTLQKPPDDNPNELIVNFTRPTAKDQDVEIEYVFPLPQWIDAEKPATGDSRSGPGASPSVRLPARVRRFALPLVQPIRATRGETKVRVWCDIADQPATIGGHWEELPTEIVADRENLPALVLEGGLERSLPLSLTRTNPGTQAAALIDRILVRAQATESGLQIYRTKFLLSQLNVHQLNIDLPALLARSNVEIRFGGGVIPFEMLDDSGREVDVGKTVRIKPQPDLFHEPVPLEVRYEIDANRIGGNGPMQSTFVPPRIQNGLLLGRMRWAIRLPGGWMVVRARPTATAEQRWGWSGFLFSPQPAYSGAALDQWVQKSDKVLQIGDWRDSFVAWQDGPEPLQLLQVPQRIWLLGCSLVLLALGFFLLFVPLARLIFWAVLVSLGMMAVALELLWPEMFSAIVFGCEPGIVVLILATVIYGALHHRYRRRVILLPGFTRVKPTSSVIRSGGSERRRDEVAAEQLSKKGSSVSSEVPA